MPSLLERVTRTLFGAGDVDEGDRQLIEEATEAIVETVEPRVRARSGYRDKLAGSVSRMITHLRALGREALEPVCLSRSAWSQDSRVNAFFASADEVPACIGRSEEVRRFFEQHSECKEAFALLGMKREERKVLAPALEGDSLRQDVARVSVSFSGHRLIAPGSDAAQTRLEVGRRIIERLAQLALGRVASLGETAAGLEQHKAYLATRLRMLKLGRGGIEGLVSDPGKTASQIRELEDELKQAAQGYAEAKSSLANLDATIDQIDAVLARPAEQVALTHVPLRLNRMGIEVEAGSSEPAADLDLTELSLGDGLRATVALARIPRSELPPREDRLAQAEKYL
jgi:hypothetical protein